VGQMPNRLLLAASQSCPVLSCIHLIWPL
jgi:hypothetical protein